VAGITGVKFIVAGKTYKGSATDASGVAAVVITAPRSAGIYPISVTWAGDATRAAASGGGTLTVL
jgi:hypothetical protein